MPRIRTYQCPSCVGRFSFTHHPSDEPPPRFCPLCGFDTEFDPDAMQQVLTAPHIGKPIAKLGDQTYRQLEAGSEFRAQMAMEQHGLDTEQANALKITNMRDNAHYGETSVVEVNNEVTRVMAQVQQMGGQVGYAAQTGLGYSSTVSTGPFPNAGARAQKALRAAHSDFTAGAGHSGTTVSDTPALETQMPGYRQRVR